MDKITISIDLGKIDKERINNRTYTNKDGVEVTIREYKMEVVPLKEKKVIKSGEGWTMVKSHFVADAQTKEERANKTQTNFLGDGIKFENSDTVVDNNDSVPF